MRQYLNCYCERDDGLLGEIFQEIKEIPGLGDGCWIDFPRNSEDRKCLQVKMVCRLIFWETRKKTFSILSELNHNL